DVGASCSAASEVAAVGASVVFSVARVVFFRIGPNRPGRPSQVMTDLELKFLGELEVLRGGQVLPLPPSRKTRALLAWLALNPKPFRREQLCELLWDIPDDPRGSLRWSLS